MPLQRRVPKFGFKNINRIEYKGINVSTLQELAEKKKLSKVDIQTLIDAGLVSKNDKVKILGNGELKIKLEVKAHAFSKTAIQAIESLQGTVEKI
jgi:large subunit ribosomal protein L15